MMISKEDWVGNHFSVLPYALRMYLLRITRQGHWCTFREKAVVRV